MKQNNGCRIIISILMFVGYFAITMDTTVDTGFGGMVHNLGLMNDKTNIIIVVGFLLVGAIIFLVFSESQSNASPFKEVEVDYLQERNGIAYETNKDNPFTGKLTIRYDNGQKKEEVNFKNGQKHGLFTKWHDNGQKKEEGTFKHGLEKGLFTKWYGNGHEQEEVNFRNGQKHGLFTKWNGNGEKQEAGTFKDGEKHEWK